MNRAWKTGLALGGVLGSAGAAYAGVSAGTEHASLSAEPSAAVAAAQHTATHVVSYQVGTAGSVQLTSVGGVLSVSSATAASGWTLVSSTSPGAHIEVQFSDGLQLVTFSADAGEDGISVALANVPAPGAPTTTAAPAPMGVTVIADDPIPGSTTPRPTPATPAPTNPTTAPTSPHTEPPHTTQPAPATTQPSPATTSAPSSGGGDDDHDDDHGGDDDHEEPSDD